VFKLSDSSCPCNDASHSGALKFADDQIYVCNGKKWKMVHLTREVSGPYGSEDNPGLSCDDIYDERIRDGQLEDGIYWLHLNLIGSRKHEAFPVYCDMKNKGWTMVFKIMSGVRTSPWSVLSSLTTVNELEKEALDITNTDFRQHYKSRIMLLWESFKPAQARMTVHKDGSVKRKLIFNAQKTNFASWFRRTLLTYSSWVDLPSHTNIGVFSLTGPCKPERGLCNSFRITYAYKTRYEFCHSDDNGWIYRGTFDDCDWEKSKMHKIFYCPGDYACNFHKEGDTELADFAAIFVTRRRK